MMEDWMKIAISLALALVMLMLILPGTLCHPHIYRHPNTEAVDITDNTWQLNMENNQNRRLHRIPSARVDLRGKTSVV
jgi:hypothetical protein